MQRRQLLKNMALILGGTISAPTVLAMENFDKLSTNSESVSGFKFTNIQSQLIAEISEIIIPKTDTPGAKDVGVPDFIEMMLKDCYKEPEQLSFMEGLVSMEKVKFLSLNSDEKNGVLKFLEQETKKITGKATPFWRLIKELTLLGYFTSEAGLKASFEYVQIPGKLELIKLKPNQKSYAY